MLPLSVRPAWGLGGKGSAYSAGIGKGSRFTVWLPRVMATDVLPEHREESGKPACAAMTRVLVVDDNKNAAEML